MTTNLPANYYIVLDSDEESVTSRIGAASDARMREIAKEMFGRHAQAEGYTIERIEGSRYVEVPW